MSQLTIGDVAQADARTPACLVVLVDAREKVTASSYVDGRACLSQVAAMAKVIPRDIAISLFVGHTSTKWEGRGTRSTSDQSPEKR